MTAAARRLDLRLAPAVALTGLGCWWVVGSEVTAVVAVVTTLVVAAMGCGLWLALSAARRRNRARHRRAPRDRVAATLLLASAVAATAIGLGGLRAAERAGVIDGLDRDVTALVRVSAEADLTANQQRSAIRTRVLVDVIAVAGQPPIPTVPALVIGDQSWLDADLGSTWWVPARVVPVSGSPGVLLIVDGAARPHGAPRWHERAVGSLRGGLVQASSPLPAQARGLVPGITLGDTRQLPADLEADLRTVSLTHITAVSGAHVAIVLGAVMACLLWAPVGVRVAVGMVVLAAFVVLVFPTGSVVRAATMGAIVLIGLATGRPRQSVSALLATVVVLLIADPWLARDFGFVLSVAATGGLLALAPAIATRLERIVPPSVAMMMAVPAAAQLLCAPVILLLAPGLPTHGVAANVLAAPAVPPATILGVLATLCHPVWPAGGAGLARAAGWCTAWIANVAERTAALPVATLPWPEGPGGTALAGAALLALWAWWSARRRR